MLTFYNAGDYHPNRHRNQCLLDPMIAAPGTDTVLSVLRADSHVVVGVRLQYNRRRLGDGVKVQEQWRECHPIVSNETSIKFKYAINSCQTTLHSTKLPVIRC
ncbi:MAG: hypothetical protein DCC55_00310 [Chloroflexi bacterium]|nr:MAG: hypothetical protein DCC55_00310 [Chloroflexota bacterium]